MASSRTISRLLYTHVCLLFLLLYVSAILPFNDMIWCSCSICGWYSVTFSFCLRWKSDFLKLTNSSIRWSSRLINALLIAHFARNLIDYLSILENLWSGQWGQITWRRHFTMFFYYFFSKLISAQFGAVLPRIKKIVILSFHST